MNGTGPGAGRRWRRAITLVPLLAAVFLLLLYPLGLMITAAFRGAKGWSLAPALQVISSRVFASALGHTLQIALTATILCLLLGFVLALLLNLAPFRGAASLGRLVDAYLSFPSFLIALSLTFLYGNAGLMTALLAPLLDGSRQSASFLYGFWGVVLAEVTFYTPFVLRPLLAGFQSLDPALLEMASGLGEGPIGVVRRVVVPALLPSLLAGGGLCLLLTLNEFGIMLVMGAKNVITLPMLIYGDAVQQFNYAGASIIAVCDAGLSLAVFALYRLGITRLGAWLAS
ncbi:unnamed protein product [Acidocella sp. C78]|uniref:2-aminoethylphosphonate ABC transporter permease subunit n=1 Tax=Acidocella sp. C78 TaxID=1671486 RepID=UPI00191BB31B|nr:2-aminoethylphosphonate ABC transporter permease subunit [Acidocella sp. C78]CAG4928901.1 unnamed protein product [Acidocella sp. C78]